MNDYVQYLSELIPDKDSLKLVKTEAKRFYKEHTAPECREVYPVLYRSENFQIQEVGVFLAGYIADEYPDALAFLHDTVSRHASWKVQEILAEQVSGKMNMEPGKARGLPHCGAPFHILRIFCTFVFQIQPE